MLEETATPATHPAAPMSGGAPAAGPAPSGAPASMSEEVTGDEIKWVWTEVRKRVFIKLPFSRNLADALEAVVPVVLDGDNFVCGLTGVNFPLSNMLNADDVRNTIEAILKQAAGRSIHFEVIEGITLDDWHFIRDRRHKASEAMMAISERKMSTHQFEDVLNQIVTQVRSRVTSTKDRIYPQVRARLILEIAPDLAAAEEMLFEGHDSHDGRRAFARAVDRIAGFLEITPLTLALEIERCHRLARQ